MKDILKYRLPNKQSVFLNGRFVERDSLEDFKGFFVTDFNKDKKYCFLEGDNTVSKVEGFKMPISITQADYLVQGQDFLSGFKKNKIDKAIFSRVKIEQIKVDAEELFEKLCELYPNTFVYLIKSQLFGTWIGATPETLLKRQGTECETMSLAGTKPVKDNSAWSDKEIQEQKYVTDFIDEVLVKSNVSSMRKGEVETVSAGPVKHLRTEFKFELDEANVLKVASELHPTPAVSGLPRESALDLIKKYESHERRLYAGIIGIHSENDSDLFVNLRCAQIFDNQIALYLGGGYTKDSIVEKEWEETESKALTLLDAISQLYNK